MKCTRPRSFLSSVLLGLSIFFHRRFGSKCILDILSSLGFSNSYNDALLYEAAAISHPQSNILSPGSGSFVQYSADNADININTIDGHNTMHIMGVIQIVTPKSAVIDNKQIPRLKQMPAAKGIANIAHVPLQVYGNYGVCGLSKMEVEMIYCNDVSIQYFLTNMDFLWMFGKWKIIPKVPG